MPQTKLNIKLLEITEPALSIIYAACRQCYSAEFAGNIFKSSGQSRKKQGNFIKKIVESGHESPLEHVKFSFAVEGVSRALTHQLVRHRIASFSQQSQRYVRLMNFNYIMPASIKRDKILRTEFVKVMEQIQSAYNRIIKRFEQKGKTGEKANQDARFILPQAAETKIVITMNCRELLHFFRQRCCARAQWEIRELANQMLKICRARLSEIFSSSGPKCVSLGYCPEGERFSCGRYPLKKEVIK